MAKEVQTLYVDDIDGGEATRTVSFSWDNKNFEIDLNQVNIDAAGEVLAPFVAAARRTGRTPATRSRTGRQPGRAVPAAAPSGGERSALDLSSVRGWARSAGHVVSDRGRIAGAVIEAYYAAQGVVSNVVSGDPDVEITPPTVRTPRSTASRAAKSPAKKSPGEKAAAKRAPAKRAPAKKAPAKKAPAKETPAVKAPAKRARASKRTAPTPAAVEAPPAEVAATLSQD